VSASRVENSSSRISIAKADRAVSIALGSLRDREEVQNCRGQICLDVSAPGEQVFPH
jgi:hypothetical protein